MKHSDHLQRRIHVLRPTVVALACSAAFASLAHAQQDTTPQQGDAKPAAAEDKSSNQMQEIVVTAQRRSASILKTPLAITAVTGDDLTKSGTDNALLLGNSVPNLQIQRSVGLQISIRGVSNENSLQSGDPSAAFNVDGVYIARQQAQGNSFFDLERIEVLRGPQGTLYGRNATGGAINLIPNKPTDTLEGSYSFEFGSFNTIRNNAMLNVPVNDKLALRAAISTNRHDSYLVSGANTLGGANSQLGQDQNDASYRVQALFKPTPSTNLRISIDGNENRALPPMQVPLSNFYRNAAGNVIFSGGDWYSASSEARRTVDWDPQFTGRNSEHDHGFTTELNHDLGFANLTYLGAWRKHDYDKDEPVFFLGLGQAHRGQTFRAEQTSHELRLASNGKGPLTWVAGAYHFSEKTDGSTLFAPPLPGPLLGTINGQPVNYRNFEGPAKADSTALFAQGTYSIIDPLRLTVGVRGTKDNKSTNGQNTQQLTRTFNPATDIALLNIAEVSYSKTNYKAGFEYDLAPKVMAFGSVSTGYKAGGYNAGCLATTPGCNNVTPAAVLFYNPETLTAYEAGIKGRTNDNSLQASLNFFHYSYNDMQLQGISASTGVVTTTNAAKANIDGVELEGAWRPLPHDRVKFSASYLKAEYGDYQINATTNWKGYSLDRAPKYSVMVSLQHTFSFENGSDLEAELSTRAFARQVFSNFNGAVQYDIPRYTRTDFVLTYNDPKRVWYAQAYVNNIEDEVRPQGAVLGAAFLTDPRTYGLRIGAHF